MDDIEEGVSILCIMAKQYSDPTLLGGRHKEGKSRGTDHDPTSLEHRKGEGWITVDVVLNIEI